MLKNSSIRIALIRYLILFALLPVFVIVVGYSYVSYSNAETEFTKNRMEVLNGISREIQTVYDDTLKLSELIYVNPYAMSLLSQPAGIEKYPYHAVKAAQSQFSDLSSYISSSQYLKSTLLFSENSLDIRWGVEAAFINLEDVTGSRWYQEAMLSRDTLVWVGEVQIPSSFGKRGCIAVLRKLTDLDTGRYIGNLLFLFDRQLYSSLKNGSHNSFDSELMIFSDAGQLIFATDEQRIPLLEEVGEKEIPAAIQYNGEKRYVFHMRTYMGWRIYEATDAAYFASQQRNLVISSNTKH